MQMILIAADQIYQHPDNPRKNLGDISELTESIKKQGIMQNLTVIPGHWMDYKEHNQAINDYLEHPDEENLWKVDSKYSPEGYTLLIGHRRFSAGKAAGLTEFPCKIAEGLNHRDQVGIMLQENMQRNDLTITEQAQGFQMMLDLGDTEAQIAERTGFSRTTVRRRLQIAKLDQNILKEKQKDDSFQLSLKDLYALEQVEDVRERDKILKESSNSSQLIWRASESVRITNRNKSEKKLIAMLETRGVQKAPKKAENEYYSGKWEKVRAYGLDDELPQKLKLPQNVENLYYLRMYSSIYVLKKVPHKKETEQERKTKERDRNRKEIKGINKALYKRMKDFVRDITDGKIYMKDSPGIVETIWILMFEIGVCIYKSAIYDFYCGKPQYECTGEELNMAAEYFDKLSTQKQMLIYLWEGTDSCLETADWRGQYNEEKGGKLLHVCQFMEQYGFTLTEQEWEVAEGRSDLYELPEE